MLTSIINYISKYFPFIKKLETFIKYSFASLVATIIDVCILYVLVQWTSIPYKISDIIFGIINFRVRAPLISAAISYTIGLIINFTLTKFYAFKNKYNKITKQFILYTITSLIGLLLTVIIIKIIMDIIGSKYYMIGKITAIGIVFFWNYFINKKFIFKKEHNN